MAYAHYDRLSSLDATFLTIESPSVHMHVGAVAVFEGGETEVPDLEKLKELSASTLGRTPRLRQRLEPVPGLDHWVWVDDDRFQIEYHLRHTALPQPGDTRQLKRLAGRIFSQKLDMHRPAWEMWLVEGLEDGGFALISKMHHCMVDGISGVNLIGSMLAGASQPQTEEHRWLARPRPTTRQLVRDELAHRATLPARAMGAGIRALGKPIESLREARRTATAVGHTLTAAGGSASPTPLNDPIGPYRRFDWLSMDRASLNEVRERFGATLNDVVLAIVSGAMRSFLARRGLDVDRIDFRAMVPVSRRTEDERGKLGNRVISLVAKLPVGEPDPSRRVVRVCEAMGDLKQSDLAEGNDAMMAFADASLTTLVAQFARFAARARAYNMVVTNVPGPRDGLELLGARLSELYPLVPLFSNQALGIALFTYDGQLFWGLNADWDAVPDLHEVVDFLAEELALLRKAEGVKP
ncbi:MAG: wax ester/triacylglycerol synthase family O-acyltransferase [Myxococcota bacterium]